MHTRIRPSRRWGCFLVLGQEQSGRPRRPWTLLGDHRPTHWLAARDVEPVALATTRFWIGAVVCAADDAAAAARAAELRAQLPELPIATPAAARAVTRIDVVSFARDALIYESLGAGPLAQAARREVADKRLSILETDVFAQALAGTSRSEILVALGISNNTLKKALRSLLVKCDAISLERCTADFLRRLLGAERTSTPSGVLPAARAIDTFSL